MGAPVVDDAMSRVIPSDEHFTTDRSRLEGLALEFAMIPDRASTTPLRSQLTPSLLRSPFLHCTQAALNRPKPQFEASPATSPSTSMCQISFIEIPVAPTDSD